MVNKQSSTLLPVSEEEWEKLLHTRYHEIGLKTAASIVLPTVGLNSSRWGTSSTNCGQSQV